MVFFIMIFTLILPLGPILIDSNATDFSGYVADLKYKWTTFFDPVAYEEGPQNDGV